MTPPKVFFSYSHDSAEHKEWVLRIATTLRERGVDVVLDQWDLAPGNDLPHFMETSLEECDYTVMVCTETYVAKANDGKGGVGYEKMILTSQLMKKIGDSKVIPIVREQSDSPVPIFLASKLHIDFSKNEDVEYSLDELLRTLLDKPLFEKPEIGSNPFSPLAESKPDRTSDAIKAIMKAISSTFDQSNTSSIDTASALQRAGMPRLKGMNYLEKAEVENLILVSTTGRLKVTAKGYAYLVEHGIIED
jgi:hypothetical protein